MSILRLPENWSRNFDRSLFPFAHELAGNEALQLDALRDIVLSLPPDQVFASRADLKIDTDFDRAHVEHAIDQSLSATLANMATSNSYVMVRKPDTHPRLRPILERFMLELTEQMERAMRESPSSLLPGSTGFRDPMLYLFISSPNSVTPFHVDRYSTLLLQLQGEKDVMIWDRADREVVTEQELESLFGKPRDQNPSYKGNHTRAPEVTHLRPGEGVHIPFIAPHWVKNGPQVSVSVSFIWQTKASRRRSEAHEFNYHARRMLAGMPALQERLITPVGSPVLDSAKSTLTRSYFAVKRRLPRSKSSNSGG